MGQGVGEGGEDRGHIWEIGIGIWKLEEDVIYAGHA